MQSRPAFFMTSAGSKFQSMLILSHRGDWQSSQEKNSLAALRRSLIAGFGTETDVRDSAGELVISHDPPVGGELPAAELFRVYRELDCSLTLAVNIKADGLQSPLKQLLDEYGVQNYFVFDAAVPDALGYLRAGLTAFTRQSEVERNGSFYEQAAGVWMDMFFEDWIEEADILAHLEQGKRVCIVSPELHRREHLPFWTRLASMNVLSDDRVMICTDHAHEAARFFERSRH